MRLQSKKIGVILKVKQLGDTRILKEIKRMMFEGAEVMMILRGGKKKPGSLAALFHKLTALHPSPGDNKEKISEKNHDPFFTAAGEPFFDLLVFIPGSGKQLKVLSETIPRDFNSLPLVIAPVLEGDPHPPLSDISALLEIPGIYFVPFGPLTCKKEEKEHFSTLFSRLDLLTEACIAALEGHRLKHSFWENNFFPG